MANPLIEQHGIIGNMQSAALVSIDGAIDFYCFPDFDSPSVFAALLDTEKGGSFEIVPKIDGMRTKQLYLPDTNILLTRFLSDEGVFEITDFMPITDGASKRPNQIVRNLRVIKGDIAFHIRCAPRFDYARSAHSVIANGERFLFQPVGQTQSVQAMSLRATVPLAIEGADVVGDFTLTRGQTATFLFGGVVEDEETDGIDEHAFDKILTETSGYWRVWISQSRYQGRWREMVNRSALVLKLLSSQRCGSLIAAPTFGLPERLGGARNWDYRLCWLRDSSFTLYAFMRLGFTDEARKFGVWMRERIAHGLKEGGPDGPLKPMYKICDSSDSPEEVLEHLAGYRDSRPVRIGNAAQSQLQLDIYGELLDAMYLSAKYTSGVSHDGWNRVKGLLAWLADNWNRPDQGIWEVRNGQQHFLHSRLMCWVAFDRAIRLAEKRSLAAPHNAWMDCRDAIREDIFNNFWSEKLNSFVQSKESEILDASVLLMPLMRFINANDPRWLSTMAAIEEHLSEGGIIARYASGIDGLDGEEGRFIPCSFWFIECLARSGQVEKAQLLFDKLLGYANHLGLYAEELGGNGEQLGNFPQALTHLALISAASFLDRRLSGNKDDTWQ
jgi:GH15 family glucan-1,4-alpha-glucosidase